MQFTVNRVHAETIAYRCKNNKHAVRHVLRVAQSAQTNEANRANKSEGDSYNLHFPNRFLEDEVSDNEREERSERIQDARHARVQEHLRIREKESRNATSQ